MKHPLELGTKVRWEESEGSLHGAGQHEGVILSSKRDTNESPVWQYEVSESGEPVETPVYPFEEYPDAVTIFASDVVQYVDESDQQWHYIW